ncbi:MULTISPECIES: hypothetical protein, partial [unclassified Acidovorax]|uniref:hypothetical protein n=1 Tax=unclassified Acidovorax TaxID=2684926 RepID=UPI000BDB32D2
LPPRGLQGLTLGKTMLLASERLLFRGCQQIFLSCSAPPETEESLFYVPTIFILAGCLDVV